MNKKILASLLFLLAPLSANAVVFQHLGRVFTATGNGETIDVSRSQPAIKNYALTVVQTGSVTSWDVRAECSLDNSTFTQLIAQTNADGSGTTKFASASPCLYIRVRVNALSLGAGTNIITYFIGTD